MDVIKLKKKFSDFLSKYKYAAIVLLVGVMLMLIPGRSETDNSVEIVENSNQSSQEELDIQLSHILSRIEGAGEVEVLLTVAYGAETVFESDESTSFSSDSGNSKKDTVIITDSSKNQSGLIRQTNPPIYLGAVVLCQGADSAEVRFAIVDAVSKVTGLGANCISVLKMK